MPSARFPPEIWQLIIDSLSLHCNCDVAKSILPGQRLVSWLQWPNPWSDGPSPLAALANLCRASKMMHHLATPALYHLPITNRPFRLLRTLTDRPELADLVRELHSNTLSGWTYSENERNAYPMAFLDIYDDYHNYILEERPDSRLELGDRSPDDLDGIRKNTINNHVRDTTIVALLPNLACVSVESYYHEVYVGLDPGSLPSLTSACVSHGDTEGFVSPLDLCDFAEAVPKLARLHLHMAGTENSDPSLFPFFPRVTDLTMDMSAVAAGAWPCLLDAFPRLKTLVYTGSSPSEYSQGAHARAIQAALVQHRPDLERLCVVFSHIQFIDGSEESERAFDEGLSSLRALRYLITDSSSIGSPAQGICVESLPASLRGLRIICWRPQDPETVGKALLALAEVAPVRLPELQSVIVVSHQVLPLAGELTNGWNKAGVDFTHATGDHGLGSWHDLDKAMMGGRRVSGKGVEP